MQISRLFEILYLLIEKKQMTAKELSQRFEVSSRTIYRDVETLSMAGIPVYTSKGKGGGIGILDNFVLNKALLSRTEQADILDSLQGLQAIHGEEEKTTFSKLSSLFGKEEERENWIEVDFSTWGSSQEDKDKFTYIKKSILDHIELEFTYYSAQKEGIVRTVRPIRLIFKSQAWYLYAFCNLKQDYRVFKLNRIQDLKLTDQTFTPMKIPPLNFEQWDEGEMETIEVRVLERFAYRIFDELKGIKLEKVDGHWFHAQFELPVGPYLVNYMLSFEDGLVVEKPEWLRNEVLQTINKTMENYRI